ncbi:MAG: ferrochelatase [Polyangiaceae bacterium]
MTHPTYDALLLLSFGGPEGPDDVMPFLENVTRGRGVPRERLLEVAEHYGHFGGKSPLNEQVRDLGRRLGAALDASGTRLPIYIGHRNWKPFLADTVAEMKAAGVTRALAFATSAFSSYSGCRQYLEDIDRARAAVGEGAPVIDKIRPFFDHPRWIEAVSAHVSAALDEVGPGAHVVFTAHSVPLSMASGCDYAAQLAEAARLVALRVGAASSSLAYQSRSGPPAVPWLEPDIRDELRALHAKGVREVVVAPLGFVSDHVEVLYDLDVEARATADELGLAMARASTASTHPAFISLVEELLAERARGAPRQALGVLPERPDPCANGCCPRGGR